MEFVSDPVFQRSEWKFRARKPTVVGWFKVIQSHWVRLWSGSSQ